MVDRGHGPGLTTQSLPHYWVARQLGLDDLERDRAVQPQLPGPIEDPEAAEPYDSLDFISGES